MCSLSWREPKSVKRPIIATVGFASPFQVLTRQVTLKASDRKPPDLGPKVRIETAHLTPTGDDKALAAVIGRAGLRDIDRDGLLEQDTSTEHMWLGTNAPGLTLEFDLPEAVPLSAMEVWNYNAAWETTDGIRKADVAVSPDGSTWQTVLRGAEFAEAEGIADYDQSIQLKLNGATARKVRFENIVPWNDKGRVGLSKVVFHQAQGPQAAPKLPEDGATGVGITKLSLNWVPGQGAGEHKVLLGTSPDNLSPLGTSTQGSLEAPSLKPDTTYYWRVNAAQPDGKVVAGRTACFQTTGFVAWWKLDESKGNTAADATGHDYTGTVMGRVNWAPEQGRIGGALEFDGKTTWVNCGRAPEFDFRDTMTAAAWIKVREFSKPYQAIVTKGDTAWRLERCKDSGQVSFACSTGAEGEPGAGKLVRLVSKRKVDDGQWHHVAGVVDGQRALLYVDGELEDSADAKPIARSLAPVMIGCNANAYERRFNGWIDDVRLYGYGLTPEQVKALYSGNGESQRAEK
jgi:hypothetical protein